MKLSLKNNETGVFAIGGLGEIGKNMYGVQFQDEIIIIDAGIKFPEDDLLGIDYVIPDFSYVVQNINKVKALVITHGHEDHIGGVPYLLKQANIPIYAGALALALIKNKLDEHGLLRDAELHEIDEDSVIRFRKTSVSFFRTTHSIPDPLGVVVKTPSGNIVETGDFKFDFTPVGQPANLHRMAKLGEEGVLCLLSDSTNAEVPTFTKSEQTIGQSILRIMEKIEGRIIFATFASNISRLQQAASAAVATGRKIAVFGRSMENAIVNGQKLGYISVPDGTFVDAHEINHLPANELMILCTGSQGEPMAGLSRMATSNHRTVELAPNDTVIISATPIPGNEGAVGRTIDNLLRLGCNVVYGKDRGIHVSGHASQEELKTMLNLVRPEYFIPVHGEYRMLRRHGELGVAMGVDPKKVLIGDNGQIFEFDKDGGRKGGRVQAGAIFVDGLGVGDVGNIVIRDRQQLAQEGMVIVVMAMDKASGTIVAGPDLVSRGFVYVRDAEELMLAAERRVEQVLEDCEMQRIKDWTTIKQNVRDALGKFFYDKTRRRPMILPIIQDV